MVAKEVRMNIVKINGASNSFKGLLTITGPDKDKAVTVNTNSVSTILNNNYLDKKEDSLLGVGYIKGAVISMNNGTNIYTSLPTETIIDAYKKAKDTGSYQVESKYNPGLYKPLL